MLLGFLLGGWWWEWAFGSNEAVPYCGPDFLLRYICYCLPMLLRLSSETAIRTQVPSLRVTYALIFVFSAFTCSTVICSFWFYTNVLFYQWLGTVDHSYIHMYITRMGTMRLLIYMCISQMAWDCEVIHTYMCILPGVGTVKSFIYVYFPFYKFCNFSLSSRPCLPVRFSHWQSPPCALIEDTAL